MKTLLVVVMLAASAGTASSQVARGDGAATAFQIVTLDCPGSAYTTAMGINNHGDIVGVCNVPNTHKLVGFVRSEEGDFSLLDPPGSISSAALGINDRGQVVGFYQFTPYDRHGFLRHKIHDDAVVFDDIDVDGAVATEATAINESGTIVGMAYAGDGTIHGYILKKGVIVPLDAPDARDTAAFGINARGDVAGNWDTNPWTTGHGFVVSKGHFRTFDAPDAAPDSTAGFGINDRGQVVGFYTDLDGKAHGFLATETRFTTIDVPGAVWTSAQGINSDGHIVGQYGGADGRLHGFVAYPASHGGRRDVPTGR